MGKYEPLALYLESQREEIWDAPFADIERVLGFPLPRSAYHYPAWWANQEPGHSQTQGWRAAGWETSRVDLAARRVRFHRTTKPRSAQARDAASAIESLLEQARRITGIDDRDALIEAALTALIRGDAARKLIALGGTMPDAEAAPRERPWA